MSENDNEASKKRTSGPRAASGRKSARRGAGAGSGKATKAKAPAGRGRRRANRDPDAGPGLQSIPQPNIGVPIWLKFAVPTTLLVSAFLIFSGLVISKQTVKDLDAQINKRGVDVVSSIAEAIPRKLWQKYTPYGLEPPVPDEILRNAILEERKKLVTEWKNKLERIASNSKIASENGRQEILAALIVDYDKSKSNATLRLASAANGGNVKLTASGNPDVVGKVEIHKGLLDDVPTREFRMPIFVIDPDSGDRTQVEDWISRGNYGWASVFLDARVIQEAQASTNRNVLIISILAALASFIVIVLISALFTRPIRRLQHDIAIVAEGNLEHNTVPQSNDEIGALAQVFNVMTHNLRAAQAQEANRKAIERELSIANEIQTKLLPERIPTVPGLDIHRHYASAKEVGGDYYDFLVIDQRHLGLVVADVSGKGIPGSMVMTMVRSLLRLASVRNYSPADTFKKVNRILAKDIRRGMFVTAIYMVLDIQEKKLKVASAGHNPLVVYRAAKKKCELVKPKGIALGFDKGPIFDSNIKEVEIELQPGDRIVAYTDGVNEAMDEDEEEFGDDEFYELVRQNSELSSEDFVRKIVEALEAHRGSAEQSDDITISTLAVR